MDLVKIPRTSLIFTVHTFKYKFFSLLDDNILIQNILNIFFLPLNEVEQWGV